MLSSPHGERILHGRVLRLRLPGQGSGPFEPPVVADPLHGLFRSALDPKAFRLTMDGRDVSLSAEPGPVGCGDVCLPFSRLTIQGSRVKVREVRKGTRRVLVAQFLLREAPK
ncbi:MAG TPA: hypothetical protein VKF62_10850 [Planctomycetota bacterium]|nr:hypothetical protein [Planctomycetota bacterium]